MGTKLILVDGVFGAGKSTITSLISKKLTDQKIKNIYFEEEGEDNPLYLDYCEDVVGRQASIDFYNKTLELWEEFVKKQTKSNKIAIIESTFFQNTIRILFSNLYTFEELSSYMLKVSEIIETLEPVLVYLHKEDIEASIREIWDIRGEDFKNYCIEYDGITLYAKKNKLEGDYKTIELWNSYQKITDKLYSQFEFKKILIESDNRNWEINHNKIYDFLDNL